MTFEQLLARLLHEIRRRIENGQLTERGLARRIRISQPHMHHILSGKRGLTPQMADRLLAVLGLAAEDLLDLAPDAATQPAVGADLERCALLPLWEGLVAPGHLPPQPRNGGLYFPFPVALLGLSLGDRGSAAAIPRFAVVRLGNDPLLGSYAQENDLLVISPLSPAQAASLPIAQAAIWMLDGSWVVDELAVAGAVAGEPSLASQQRWQRLREEGVLVATVHWLIRKLRPIRVGGDAQSAR
ncbi:MAG: hypothetical protein MUF01_18895 [Bryobacterales bacterium]|nr:hypothetical protein [Bryobacterales bacterium]